MASFNVVIVLSFLLVSFVHLSWSTSIEIPEGCEDKLYCEIKPKNFPQDYFDEVVSDMQAKDFMRPARYDDEPKERIFYDEENCDTKVSIIQPFIIRTNTTTKFVVQTNVFEQRIKQTECLNKGSRCFKGITGLSYEPTCVSTLGTIKMYLYDPLNKELEYEAVTFSACCSCSFTSMI